MNPQFPKYAFKDFIIAYSILLFFTIVKIEPVWRIPITTIIIFIGMVLGYKEGQRQKTTNEY